MDVDCAGLWPHEEKQDPSCVKSETGFAICIVNCPIGWPSKLQPDIVTSTMEAEYNALSMAMRSILPLLAVLKVDGTGVGMSNELITMLFKTTVWEDDVGALTLANMELGVMSHVYYGSNACVNLCEIKPHCHFNNNQSISPKVLSMETCGKL